MFDFSVRKCSQEEENDLGNDFGKNDDDVEEEKKKKKKMMRRNEKKYPTEVVTRATNATRVRPEDDSTYVTTLTKPTKGKYEVGIRGSDFAQLYRVWEYSIEKKS